MKSNLATRFAPFLGVLALASASPAGAAFVTPTTWIRNAVNSTYAEWDVFTSATGVNAPDVGVFNPNAPLNAGVDVWDAISATSSSFVTGGGNIYSFSAPTDIKVSIPSYARGAIYHTTVIVQTQTIGSEIVYGSANIGGVSAVADQELSRIPVGSPGGDTFNVDHLFRWELTGNASSYTIELPASGSSMSFDRVAVDTLTTLDGDANRDSVVDLSDVQMIAQHWLTTTTSGDVNYDGIVDLSDVQRIAQNWGHHASLGGEGAGEVSVVPEPATWSLLLSGAVFAVGVVLRRRMHSHRWPHGRLPHRARS